MIEVKFEDIKCDFCYGVIENAVSCTSCDHSYCWKCVNEYIEKQNNIGNKVSCPICRAEHFSYKSNVDLDNIINEYKKGFEVKKCKKCLKQIKIEDYDNHIKICKKICCKICLKEFDDEDSFINHYKKEGNYREYFIACYMLNKKSFCRIYDLINIYSTPVENPIEKVGEKNKIYKDENKLEGYSDFLHKDGTKKNFGVLKEKNYDKLLNKKFDIIYCKEINKITGEKCQPGNLLCPECLKANQSYHGLKKYYLINSAGRVCIFREGRVFCQCSYEKSFKSANCTFKPTFLCRKENICKPCQQIYNHLNKYLSEELINKFKKVDKKGI